MDYNDCLFSYCGIIDVAIFFRKKSQLEHVIQTSLNTRKEPEKPRENLNLRSIGDIEERDEDLQVHEKETIISVPIEDIEEVEENEE